MRIIWTESYGDGTIKITSEIKRTIREADAYVQKETGHSIEDFLWSVVKDHEYCFDSEEDKHWPGHENRGYELYSYDEANEIICDIIWNEADNYVEFMKDN